MAIANPASVEFMNVNKAGDALTAREKASFLFINHFSRQEPVSAPVTAASAPPEEKVGQAITAGDKDGITALIDQAMISGKTASQLVDDYMIPAIVRVGDLYEKKVYFLPQLMAAAETMKKALSHLDPQLEKRDGRQQREDSFGHRSRRYS